MKGSKRTKFQVNLIGKIEKKEKRIKNTESRKRIVKMSSSKYCPTLRLDKTLTLKKLKNTMSNK
jgi:hypothetical protein